MEQIKSEYYKLDTKEVLSSLKTSFDGLTKEDVTTREKIYGKNILTGLHKVSFLLKFFKQFKDVLIILLIVSDVISFYLDDFR